MRAPNGALEFLTRRVPATTVLQITRVRTSTSELERGGSAEILDAARRFPSGQGQQEFRIPHTLVEHVQRYGPEHKFYELKLVKEILELPTVILEGLREEQEEGL